MPSKAYIKSCSLLPECACPLEPLMEVDAAFHASPESPARGLDELDLQVVSGRGKGSVADRASDAGWPRERVVAVLRKAFVVPNIPGAR